MPFDHQLELCLVTGGSKGTLPVMLRLSQILELASTLDPSGRSCVADAVSAARNWTCPKTGGSMTRLVRLRGHVERFVRRQRAAVLDWPPTGDRVSRRGRVRLGWG